jgi:hypothetical protein
MRYNQTLKARKTDMADMLDKITDALNKGVATVGVGSKAMVEKAKVKTIINNLESEKKRLAELLGMEVYTRYIESGQTPDDNELANLIAKIRNRLDGIAYQQTELKRIEEETAKVTGQNTGFTAKTGDSNKVCSCGFENESDAKFCATCGKPL